MLNLIDNLPVELMGTNVLGNLSLKDIVLLERACGSKKSHQTFLHLLTFCPPVQLPSRKHTNKYILNWFANRHCIICSLNITLPGSNPGLGIKQLKVNSVDLFINTNSSCKVKNILPRMYNKVKCEIRKIKITGDQNREVMEQLSVCTGNVKQLTISYSKNCMDWLTADILSRWKLTNIIFNGVSIITASFVSVIVQTCTELTSIKLDSYSINDAAVIAIAQHCPKLETLTMRPSNITWTSLLALSERGLPLKELDIGSIPNIPTAYIANRCSHALSCIRRISSANISQSGQDLNIFIPYMTGLTSVFLSYMGRSCIPLLILYCHQLKSIALLCYNFPVTDILSLCRANPLLEKLSYMNGSVVTDTTLIELIHACPQLHKLDLPNGISITDIGILALTEHCPKLSYLNIYCCKQVTEAAILQLLQCCRKLTRLQVSSSSLSEETWTQLDKNTQKRVSRYL